MGVKRKIIISLTILFILILINQTISFADYEPGEFGLVVTDDANATGNIKKFGADIVGIIRIVGTFVSVGIAMVLGIKYMLGSTEERAEYKKTMLPYVLGAVILFSAVNITQFFYEFVPKESREKYYMHLVSDNWYTQFVIYFAEAREGHETIKEVDDCMGYKTTSKSDLLDAIWGTQYVLNNWETMKSAPYFSKSDLEARLNVMKGWLEKGFGIDSNTVIFSGGVELDLNKIKDEYLF